MSDDQPADYSPGEWRAAPDAAVLLAVSFVVDGSNPEAFGVTVTECHCHPLVAAAMLRTLAEDIERDVVPRFLADRN